MADTEKQSAKNKMGGPRPGAGRPAGVPNRVTVEFRDTVRRVLEENSENVALWLSQVATGSHGKEPAPEKALDLLAKLAEYAAPKLARTEIAGDPEKPLKLEQVRRVIVDPVNGGS